MAKPISFLSRWTETTFLIGFLALSGSAFAYATGSWIQIGPEGGNLSALAIDPVTPSTLYAGASAGGVFKHGEQQESPASSTLQHSLPDGLKNGATTDVKKNCNRLFIDIYT